MYVDEGVDGDVSLWLRVSYSASTVFVSCTYVFAY